MTREGVHAVNGSSSARASASVRWGASRTISLGG
eukprot:CAMPEP_0183376872 /NCGR_PEP_ID=MMETSP0164_2-20130417/121544_1 /TAXON_ID=221442 /ORGANISM="Coccolithus pelagicus ssp braarudi, Strain PLY182g" /LENGTH=33 /DNA_ID= /DNA_START= /DNA_END= /DNA_ORIENTATION=